MFPFSFFLGTAANERDLGNSIIGGGCCGYSCARCNAPSCRRIEKKLALVLGPVSGRRSDFGIEQNLLSYGRSSRGNQHRIPAIYIAGSSMPVPRLSA